MVEAIDCRAVYGVSRNLPDRERMVLDRLLEPDRPSLRSIARAMNLSNARVGQIRDRAFHLIYLAMPDDRMDDFNMMGILIAGKMSDEAARGRPDVCPKCGEPL